MVRNKGDGMDGKKLQGQGGERSGQRQGEHSQAPQHHHLDKMTDSVCVCSTSGLSVDLRQAGQIGPDLENAMGSRRVRFRQA